MNAGGMNAAKNMASNAFSSAKSSITDSTKSNTKGGINWDYYNYPPLCHLIHYDLNELQGRQRSIVRKMNWSLKILLIILILNFINSIAITIGDSSAGIRILYSFLNMVIFPPVALFSFYRGYRAICFDRSYILLYYITQGILAILYFVFSIISAGAFNGWIQTGHLFGNRFIFQGILSIIESLLYMGNILLMGLTIYQAKNYDGEPEPSNNIRI